jgi:hypothetical protein
VFICYEVAVSQNWPLFIFEHDHDFHQLFGKLAWQHALKGICQFAVIPKRVSFGSFSESTPYGRSDFRPVEFFLVAKATEREAEAKSSLSPT